MSAWCGESRKIESHPNNAASLHPSSVRHSLSLTREKNLKCPLCAKNSHSLPCPVVPSPSCLMPQLPPQSRLQRNCAVPAPTSAVHGNIGDSGEQPELQNDPGVMGQVVLVIFLTGACWQCGLMDRGLGWDLPGDLPSIPISVLARWVTLGKSQPCASVSPLVQWG